MLSNCIKRDPKCPVCLFAVSAMLLLLATCCSKDVSSAQQNDADEITTQEVMQIVPLEDALKTLGTFMAEIDPDAATTKGGLTKEIANIETHYSDEVFTKSGDPVPDAYVINFTDDGGFAVLGANSNVAPIVALTENGTICGETLGVNGFSEADISETSQEPLLTEDGDFYSFSNPQLRKDAFLTQIINDGVATNNSGCSSSSNRQYVEVPPMLKTKWGQGKWNVDTIYNKYCLTPAGVYAYAGCSTIAMAQIMAYNACPEDFTINNVKIDYSKITSKKSVYFLDSDGQEQVSQLIGYVFNHVDRTNFFSEGTAISASAIRKFMINTAEGYCNVRLYSAECFCNEMIQATSDMLDDGKPVYISAFTGNIFKAHSWVIDGAKYATSGNYKGTYMVHCNWGWQGACDGYFSINSLTPSDPDAEFDPGVDKNENKMEYKRMFRVITYNLDR